MHANPDTHWAEIDKKVQEINRRIVTIRGAHALTQAAEAVRPEGEAAESGDWTDTLDAIEQAGSLIGEHALLREKERVQGDLIKELSDELFQARQHVGKVEARNAQLQERVRLLEAREAEVEARAALKVRAAEARAETAEQWLTRIRAAAQRLAPRGESEAPAPRAVAMA
ncbi:hypothetical protein [Methylobacterium sp. JK268]